MASPAMANGERRFGAAYTGRICASLFVAAFLGSLWATVHSASGQSTLGWISIILVVALAGFWILQSKSVLVVNDAGVRRESAFGNRELAWSQIAHTRYRVIPISAYAHLGLVGALLAMSSKSGRAQIMLELISADGKKLRVTSGFRDSNEAIGIILAKILPAMVQDVKARVQRGETVQFGGIGLSSVAITWKKNAVPLPEITKAEIAGTNLRIMRQGKWLAAVSVRVDKVPDVLAFLEVLESLAPQIKRSGVDPLARVRL